MAAYSLSNEADRDLGGIYRYSYLTFGEAKADIYFLSLAGCLRMLAESPRLGRPAQLKAPAILQHVIFYKIDAGGIFVVRILHRSMDPTDRLPE
jgi:toxin ParE1/3/4